MENFANLSFVYLASKHALPLKLRTKPLQPGFSLQCARRLRTSRAAERMKLGGTSIIEGTLFFYPWVGEGGLRKAETAVHGCHCPGDMAVRMRKVLTC